MDHTPTPWSDNFERGNGEITHRASGMLIAKCVLNDDGKPYDKMKEARTANAVFIVEACNSYAGLSQAYAKFADRASKLIEQRDALLAVAEAALPDEKDSAIGSQDQRFTNLREIVARVKAEKGGAS